MTDFPKTDATGRILDSEAHRIYNELRKGGSPMRTRTARTAIDEQATLENATKWNTLTDKYVFCIDLLEISAHDNNADYLVELLETEFDALLAKEEAR